MSSSAPQTQVASSRPSLSGIPPEIQELIADNTVDWHSRSLLHGVKDGLKSVLNLSLTNKALRQSCEPVLYRRVTLLPPRTILGFLQALVRTPRIARHVRSLYLPKAYRSLLQADKDWIKEATALVLSDPIAAELLRTNEIRLEVLVMIRIVQLLPNLKEICASVIVFQLGRWPDDKRFEGSSVTGLHLQGYDRSSFGQFQHCEGLGSFMQAFQAGQAPAALEELYLEHRCRPNPEDKEHRDVGADWLSFAATLERLHIHTYPFFALEAMLGVSPSLTHLCVREATMTLDQTMLAINASSQLAGTLKVLELSFMWEQPLFRSLEETFAPLSQLAKLEQLRIPMPLETPESGKMVLPPNLLDLTITWTRNTANEYKSQYFLSVLAEGIKSGKIAKKLSYIMLEWYGDETDPDSVLDGKLGADQLLGAVEAIEGLDEVCIAKKVSLMHGASAEYPCVPTPAIAHRIRQIVGVALSAGEEEGWEEEEGDAAEWEDVEDESEGEGEDEDEEAEV